MKEAFFAGETFRTFPFKTFCIWNSFSYFREDQEKIKEKKRTKGLQDSKRKSFSLQTFQAHQQYTILEFFLVPTFELLYHRLPSGVGSYYVFFFLVLCMNQSEEGWITAVIKRFSRSSLYGWWAGNFGKMIITPPGSLKTFWVSFFFSYFSNRKEKKYGATTKDDVDVDRSSRKAASDSSGSRPFKGIHGNAKWRSNFQKIDGFLRRKFLVCALPVSLRKAQNGSTHCQFWFFRAIWCTVD